ncbi:DUF3618 domain-containing protein [Streptomyces sp. NPDC046557]|uniref:DUF3618 domain-containing protein n=1 Tax=Streptomyces sp. NPDC046557 TaxID=3155372 RepID=UPI0033CE7C42
MTDDPRTHLGTPTPEELREDIRHTRDDLGQTVEALAAKADVRAQAKEKTAAVKEQAAEKAALLSRRIRAKAEQAACLVRDVAKDKTPAPVLDTATQVGQSAARTVRTNRAPAVAAGAALIVILLLRRGRRRR